MLISRRECALRIGQRDVLVVLIECTRDGAGHTELTLFDIGHPADPRLVGTFQA